MWKVIADVWEDINKSKKSKIKNSWRIILSLMQVFFVFADITDILSTFAKTDFDKTGK